jgi:hypothetical protein
MESQATSLVVAVVVLVPVQHLVVLAVLVVAVMVVGHQHQTFQLLAQSIRVLVVAVVLTQEALERLAAQA